jgi:hypothetical protein
MLALIKKLLTSSYGSGRRTNSILQPQLIGLSSTTIVPSRVQKSSAKWLLWLAASSSFGWPFWIVARPWIVGYVTTWIAMAYLLSMTKL